MNQREEEIVLVQYGSAAVDMPSLTAEEAAAGAKYISERVTRFNEELLRRAMRASRERSVPQ